jgi:hypothetical protein
MVHNFFRTFFFQERLSHGISASGFPGNHRVSDFQPPYFPSPFQSQQPTPHEVFAAQNAHLAATDPYNVTNSLHFQTSQVKNTKKMSRKCFKENEEFFFTFGIFVFSDKLIT